MRIPRAPLKFLFLALAYGGIATFVFWVFAPRWGFLPAQVGRVGNVWWLALLAAFFVKLKWLHIAWSAVPERCRVTGQGEAISPDEAAYKHLKPKDAVFWQFPAHVGLAEATNAVLASYDTHAEASTRVPFLACATLFLPVINLVAFPALLFVHMADVDAAHVEMERCLAANAHVRPYMPPQPPTMLSLAKVVAFSTLLTWIPLPFLFVELVPYTRPPKQTELAQPPPAPPAHIEADLDAVATLLVSCADTTHEVPQNLSECRDADAKLRAINAEHHDAIMVFATPNLTVWAPTYGRGYGRRRITCGPDRCAVMNDQ